MIRWLRFRWRFWLILSLACLIVFAAKVAIPTFQEYQAQQAILQAAIPTPSPQPTGTPRSYTNDINGAMSATMDQISGCAFVPVLFVAFSMFCVLSFSRYIKENIR